MGLPQTASSPYLSLGFGLSLFAVASARAEGRVANPLPAANADCYGVNLCIRPAVPGLDSSGEPVGEASGLHHVEVALVPGEGVQGSTGELQVRCEPAAGQPFNLRLAPSEVAALPDAVQYDSAVHLHPGTYRFRVTVDRRARADFIVEV